VKDIPEADFGRPHITDTTLNRGYHNYGGLTYGRHSFLASDDEERYYRLRHLESSQADEEAEEESEEEQY